MKVAIILLSLVLLSSADATGDFNPIRLRSQTLNAGKVTNCEAWRLAVEVHNIKKWKVVPAECVEYVKSYMLNANGEDGIGTQYDKDCEVVVNEALSYLETVSPKPNSNETWLFDLTDTLLSTIRYYSRPVINFGGTPFNRTKFNNWLIYGYMPQVPHIQELYNAVMRKGFKVVILTGSSETQRYLFEYKLGNVGFKNWDLFILKTKSGMPTKDFKASTRAQLRKQGYKVIGNVGDQWVDLQGGSNAGKRVFKIPNAMYYVG